MPREFEYHLVLPRQLGELHVRMVPSGLQHPASYVDVKVDDYAGRATLRLLPAEARQMAAALTAAAGEEECPCNEEPATH